MLGYMTEKQALSEGFTHHGSYYGIPLWINPYNGFEIATKWMPMEYVMTAFHTIEQMLRAVFYPNDVPVFQFTLGRKIDSNIDS